MNYQIIIDGDISRWGYSKQFLRDQLANYKGKHVDLCISSLGGDLDHGLAMRALLKDHGDVTAYLTGFVASSATVVAMGAKQVKMSKYAMFLVHKCSNFVDAWGQFNSDELAGLIDQLDRERRENEKIDVVLAQLYSEKCGKPVADILDVLKKGEWMTAQEALDYGFIDEIVEDEGGKLNLTPSLCGKLNAYRLPMPAVGAAPQEMSIVARLGQIADKLASLFAAKDKEPEPATVDVPNNSVMTTPDLAGIKSAIAGDYVCNSDGSVSLTAEQATALNERLAKLEADIEAHKASVSERDTTITELNAKIDELKKLPGDTTADVKEDTAEYMTSEEVYNIIKSL